MKKYLLSMMGLAAMAGSAMAADLPARTYPRPAVEASGRRQWTVSRAGDGG